jgi:hypothetical protein
MSKGYLYVAPVAQPKETMAEKFSSIGAKMAAGQRANQAAQMKQMQDLATQRNKQLGAFAGTMKNMDSWSQRDIEVQTNLVSQAEDLLRQDPTAYMDLLLELHGYHNLGDTQSKVRRGLNPEDETYIQYQLGEREAPVDGQAAVTSTEDFLIRSQSYDEMMEETGTYTSPTGLQYPSGNYYVPGTKTTMLAQFQNRLTTEGDPLFGAQFELVQNENGTSDAVAILDGAEVARQRVSGPVSLMPMRGNSGYFTPQFVSTAFVSPADTAKDFNTVITNLRGQVNAGEIQESEARTILASRLAENYNARSGAGMRAASMKMWEEMYPDEEYNPEDFEVQEGAQNSPAQNRGIKTPLEVYQDAVLSIADLAQDPDRSRGSQSRANDYPDNLAGWRGMTGLPEGLQSDLAPDSPRASLYGDQASAYAGLGPNVKRAEIFIGNENLEYVDPQNPTQASFFGTVIGIPDANVILLEKKAEDYQGEIEDGMPSDLANKHMNDNMTSIYWSKAPSPRYVPVSIFDADGKFTPEYMKLSQNFQYRYRNDDTVVTSDDPSKDTLFNQIMRLSQ